MALAGLQPAPDTAELQRAAAAMGVRLTLPPPAVTVWPEHARVVRLWVAMQSQWAIAPDGWPSGLQYSALPVALQMAGLAGLPPRPRRELLADLQTMEDAVLAHFAAKRQARAAQQAAPTGRR